MLLLLVVVINANFERERDEEESQAILNLICFFLLPVHLSIPQCLSVPRYHFIYEVIHF